MTTMNTKASQSRTGSVFQAFLAILAGVLLPDYNARADLSVAYSGSSDQAVIVSFFDRHTDGNNLVGTLQIQNISGTWVYIEQDLTSSPNPVALPYTIYLLGPDDIKTFPSLTFPQGSYLKLTVTTPIGLDFSQTSEKRTALQGALAVDLLTRGLLTFSLPPDAFDKPPVGEIVEPLLDTFVSTVSPIGELGVAIQDQSVSETFGAIAYMAADSQNVLNGLTGLLKNYVTADQIQNALGFFAEFINLPEKVALVTDLSARTFDAPPITWSRLDVVTRTQAPNLSSVSPTVLTTMPVPQTQQLSIHGSGLTSASSLVFTIGTATYPSRPERLQFIDANTLQYNIAVGGAVGTWSVRLANGTGSATFQVVAGTSGLYTITPLNGPHGSITPNSALAKAGGESQTFTAVSQDSTYTVDSWYVDGTAVPTTGNLFTLADIQAPHTVYVTFKPTVTTTQTGSLTVTLQPAGAVSAGAQWRVDGGSYRNTGDPATGLTPGSHTVSFKSVSGYTTPANQSANILANQQATANASYTMVTSPGMTLSVSTTAMAVGSGTGGGSFLVQSGGSGTLNWSANTSDIWLNILIPSGTISGLGGQNRLDFSFSQNSSAAPRTGTVTITANGASGSPQAVTITQGISTFYIIAISSQHGTVTKDPNFPAFPSGGVAVLTAVPDSGYQFNGWSGDITDSQNPIGVLMDGNKNITANFIRTYFLLTVSAQYGTVIKNPDQPGFTPGTVAELTAVPNNGYEFSGWSGDITDSQNPIGVLMDGDKSITANFTTGGKIPQAISFGPLSRQVFGDAPFALSASASSGLPVSFSVLSGPAILSGNIVTMTGAGLAVLRASQLGDATNAPAPNVDQVLLIAPGNNVISDTQRLANGVFTLRFYGYTGTNYVVKASTNLVNWQPVATNQISGLGYLEFIDTSSTNFDRRFYRVGAQ